MNVYPKNFFLHFLAYLWLTPNRLIGSLFWLFLKLTKNYPLHYFHKGCLDIVIPSNSWLAYKFRKAGWGAVTLGDYIFYWGVDQYAYIETQYHERRHVQQQIIFGPLFYPAYLLAFLLKALVHKSFTQGYKSNPFELDAQEYASGRFHYYKSILKGN